MRLSLIIILLIIVMTLMAYAFSLKKENTVLMNANQATIEFIVKKNPPTSVTVYSNDVITEFSYEGKPIKYTVKPLPLNK